MLDFTCSDVSPSIYSLEFEITRYDRGICIYYISEVYSHFQYPSLPTTLVPGRKKNQFNAVLDGFRFSTNKKKDGNT